MILIIGAPGAGKSVQASKLEEKGVAIWLSMGRLLRAKLTGEQKDIQSQGFLIDDSTTIKVLAEELGRIDQSEFIILDGFPRRDTQVEWLFSEDNPRELDGVVYIDVPEKEAIERLKLRKREDDTDEVIQHRYDIFHHENRPILEHLASKKVKVINVDGRGTPEEVYDRVHSAVYELSGHR